MPQSDLLLRDQFVEHVIDSDLRRELKRLVRQTPGLSMLEVRAAAIRWERVGGPSDVTRGRSYSVLLSVPCRLLGASIFPLPL